MKFKTLFTIAVSYVLPAVLIFLSFTQTGVRIFIEFGWYSLWLILVILYMKPISRIFASKRLTKWLVYRRQLGIASFWLFFFHAAGLIYVKSLYDPNLYVYVAYLFWGAVAGIGMVILGVTSNDVSVRFFKKNWKRIQYIAYPTFFATLLHVGYAERELGIVFVLGIPWIILKVLEWKKVVVPWKVKKEQ